MNYQNLIDSFFPNQFEVKTNWLDPETDEVLPVVIFGKKFKNPEYFIFKFDPSEIQIGKDSTIKFDFMVFHDNDYVYVDSKQCITERECFVELIRYIFNQQLNSLYDEIQY